MDDVGVIDAHQHCWQLSRSECHWPPPSLAAIHRDFSPEDYERDAAGQGVRGSVLVQSQPHPDDTGFLLGLAERRSSVLGVVGWADLSAEGAVATIERLARRPRLCGLRPMLEAMAEDDWVLTRARPDALSAMATHGLVFDALVRPRHLPVITELARRHPALTIVLDHAAKPDIAGGRLADWRRGLARLAERPRVYCKLSGLATEMGPGQPWARMQPYIEAVLAQFGPDRVLWGSDWPVLKLAGDYRDWLATAREGVRAYCPGQEQAVFRENARRVYRLAL